MRKSPAHCCTTVKAASLALLGLSIVTAFSAGAASANVPTNATFQLHHGLSLQTVAAEPMVLSPVALAFDEHGRLFVAEQPAFTGPTPQPGRVRLLSDLDETGIFKSSTVFAEGITGVADVACYDGGIFVAAGHEVLYLKDTLGDGKADERRTVFKGFNSGAGMARPDAYLHTILHGPDNRYHIGTSGLGIYPTDENPSPTSFFARGVDLSFDPRALKLAPESGRSLSGVTFDSRGWNYTSDPERPLRLCMYREPSMARNPFAPLPPQFIEVIRPDTTMFRLERLDQQGGTNTPNAVIGYFSTNARAPLVYQGTLLFTNGNENVFVADPSAGIVHRAEIRTSDFVPTILPTGERATTEFLSSADPEFCPTDLVNGPDGALWIADRRHNLAQGRIYRIAPFGSPAPKIQSLADATTYQLLSLLSHAGGWQRDTAARLLYEKRDPEAARLLTNVVANSRLPRARIAALWALVGQNALTEPILFRAARDTDATVREQALVLLEQSGGAAASDELLRYLGALARDSSSRVRYQLALTLGVLPRPGRAQALAEVLLRDPTNPWIAAAVLNSVDQDSVQLMSQLLLNQQARSNPALQEFQARLAEMIGVTGKLDLARQLLLLLSRSGLDSIRVYALVSSLGQGLDRAGSSLAELQQTDLLANSSVLALDAAVNKAASPALRAQATRFLGFSAASNAEYGDWLLALINPNEPTQVMLAAIAALGRFNHPQVTVELIQRWSSLPPAGRRLVISTLLSRVDRAPALLTALQTRRIPSAELTTPQLDYLRTHGNPAVSQRATELLGPVLISRPQAVQRLTPALRMQGNRGNGRSLFLQRCGSCHRLGTDGPTTALDLSAVRGRNAAQLLTDVVEPSVSMSPDFATWVVDTKDSMTYNGFLRADNASSVVLQQCTGEQTVIPKSVMLSHRPQVWSLMPATLTDDLSPQAMADLLAYLRGQPESPKNPVSRARP
jgi:putative membrane-bound dehydrogenase-like protein